MTLHIACASDDRYVPHTAAMLHSLWWHEKDQPLHVHFLCADEPRPALRRSLDAMANDLGVALEWLLVPAEWTRGLTGRDYLSRVVWHRVFLPQLLPQLERVLYLDGDVIAMQPVAPLWETPLGDCMFGAVTNVVPGYFRGRSAQLGLPDAAAYFNLGVALWNLAQMRREGFTERVLGYARQNVSKLLWLEQDAINALYHDRRLPLHPRWNCQNGLFYRSWGTQLFDPAEVEEALRAPALVHFEGGTFAKPWHFLSRHPLRGQYCFHRRQTPWPHWIPEGITPKNVLKKYLPARALSALRRIRGQRAGSRNPA